MIQQSTHGLAWIRHRLGMFPPWVLCVPLSTGTPENGQRSRSECKTGGNKIATSSMNCYRKAYTIHLAKLQKRQSGISLSRLLARSSDISLLRLQTRLSSIRLSSFQTRQSDSLTRLQTIPSDISLTKR